MGFFKAYDMRGTFGVDFDLELVEKVGRALPQVLRCSNMDAGRPLGEGPVRVLVGRDCRTTSDAVKDALVRGLLSAGAEVTDLGRSTTPMVYFFTAEDGFDGSVMVTASHNPPTDNGLKVSMRTALPVGYANGLNEVERLVGLGSFRVELGSDGGGLGPDGVEVGSDSSNGSIESKGSIQSNDSNQSNESILSTLIDPKSTLNDPKRRYLSWMKSHADLAALSSLNYAVDCSNGMASILAKDLFPGAILLNDTPDGTFPCHSPNPLKADAREQIARIVRERGLDCGVIFDGDADRAMFVDETGAFVQPDYLIPIVAHATMRMAVRQASDSPVKVIHDVRTSRGSIDALRAMGCEPVMVPVGHAFAKPILRRERALCGGELAGHYYFAEFFGCDSGVLAALRILSEVAEARKRGESFSRMMSPITSAWANSGELNFRVEDKDAAIGRVLAVAASELPKETGRETMDGIRIEYAEGWINVRKSNTEPYLRLLVECDTPERLADWTDRLSRAIRGERGGSGSGQSTFSSSSFVAASSQSAV